MLPNGKQPWDDIGSPSDTDDGDGWVMSYADMITLLFGFFVILYSFSSVDERKFEGVTANLAKTFKSGESKGEGGERKASLEDKEVRALQMLVTMMKMEGRPEDAISAIEKAYAEGQTDAAVEVAMAKIQEHAQDVKTSAAATPAETIVNLMIPGESVFKTGSAELNPAASEFLQRIARDLTLLSGITKIEITGHTDSSPVGARKTFTSNFTLSSLRAGAVAERLIRFGVEEKLLAIRGVGNLDPLFPEIDAKGGRIEANMAKNRRVQITIHRSRGK